MYHFVLLARVTECSFSKADQFLTRDSFSFFKNISSDNFLLFLTASNHQLVDKMNYIKFTGLKAFTSEFKLRTNPIKAFNGTCVRFTSITFPVIWSSVLISVTQEWRYCGLIYKFFLINNIELKCSFFRCRKYHKSCSNGAAELHISVDLLCGTTAAELHNS